MLVKRDIILLQENRSNKTERSEKLFINSMLSILIFILNCIACSDYHKKFDNTAIDFLFLNNVFKKIVYQSYWEFFVCCIILLYYKYLLRHNFIDALEFV